MLRLKFQYFGHLMWRTDSLEKTLMVGKIEGRRRRGQERMSWLDGITDSIDMSLSRLWVMDREACHAAVHQVPKNQTWLSDWTDWLTDFHVKLILKNNLMEKSTYRQNPFSKQNQNGLPVRNSLVLWFIIKLNWNLNTNLNEKKKKTVRRRAGMLTLAQCLNSGKWHNGQIWPTTNFCTDMVLRWKSPDTGKDWMPKEMWAAEDEMVR